MRRVTHQVHLPTIALGVLWIIHSVATTMYVPWQNSRQRAAMDSVLESIDTILKIQETLAGLRIERDMPGVSNTSINFGKELESNIGHFKQLTIDPESQALIGAIEAKIRLQQWKEGSANESLNLQALIEDCQALIRVERRHLMNVVDERSRTDVAVMVVRAVLLVLGLMVGVGLTMWMTKALSQSLAQISVTLQNADGGGSTDLGQIEISSRGPAGELNFLEGQVQKVITNLHSVAKELQQARTDMVRAERLAAVGEVAAGVAHEIRNPLTSVKLLVQRAAERQPVHSLNGQQMNVLLEEVSRIENTVQGMLDFARPEKPQNVRCDLSEIIAKSLTLLDGRLEQSGILLEKSTDGLSGALNGDPLLIQQVIVNIVINAIDFMPNGGTLRLHQSTDCSAKVVVLEVQDSGPGIEPLQLERIFEPFVTTRSTGSGLGLAISRRIIEEQGGTLTATNVPEGGALFRFQLPLAQFADVAIASTHESLV